MARRLRYLLHGVLFVSAFVGVIAATNVPERVSGQPAAVVHAEPLFEVGDGVPQVSAHAWAIVDIETGTILKEKNSDAALPIASVTKLVTAETARTTLDLRATTTITDKAVAVEGKAGRLNAGEDIEVGELLFPLLLESSNDAAYALSQVSGEREFLEAMRHTSIDMGLRDTHFSDPHGLSSDNVSTARDLSTLLHYLYAHDRHVLDITTLPQYVGSAHDWLNNDPVIRTDNYLGGKHGYTPEAGKTFAGIWEQELRGGGVRPVGIVVLASKDIRQDVESLRAYIRAEISATKP